MAHFTKGKQDSWYGVFDQVQGLDYEDTFTLVVEWLLFVYLWPWLLDTDGDSIIWM
jgi:hypothetical protein